MFFLPLDNEDRNSPEQIIEEYTDGDWKCFKKTEISKDGLRELIIIQKERSPSIDDEIKAIELLMNDYVEKEDYIKASSLLKDLKRLKNKKDQGDVNPDLI